MRVLTRRELLGAAVSLVSVRGGVPRASAFFRGDEWMLSLGAREAVDRIRNGELRCEAYVTALLSRYDAHRRLNLANAIDADRVREAARVVDRLRRNGRRLGPAAGLPFGVKDQILVAGYRVTAGNGALARHVASRHAAVVQRLADAGAIPFAMTSLPDMTVVDGLMHQASSHSPSFGAVRNPYDPGRIPGGSSGGSAAMLAARVVPAALGLDTNGSIRLPAALCGVAGLRPSTFTAANTLAGTSRKRYPDDGVLLPPVGRLDTIGPMARTVADVAFLDALITGEPAPPLDLRTARIAIPGPAYWEREPVDPGVAGVIREVFAKLRAAGCQLVEIDFDAEVRSLVGTIDAPTLAAVVALDGLGARRQTPETMAEWLRENAPEVTVEAMYGGRPVRTGSRQLPPPVEQARVLGDAIERYADVYRRHGVVALAFPTVPIVAPPISEGGPREPLGAMITANGQRIEEGRALARTLFIAPRLGAAALNVPAGLHQVLPVGLELDALPGNDSFLLGLGLAVEQALGPIPAPRSLR